MGAGAPMSLPVITADRLGHDGADRGQLSSGFLWWGVMAGHDGGMQPTPLRARDRRYFDSFCGALAAADGQAVGRQLIIIHAT